MKRRGATSSLRREASHLPQIKGESPKKDPVWSKPEREKKPQPIEKRKKGGKGGKPFFTMRKEKEELHSFSTSGEKREGESVRKREENMLRPCWRRHAERGERAFENSQRKKKGISGEKRGKPRT